MDNVNVAIRVRPLIQREKNADAEPQWKAETNKISQLDHRGRVSRIYAFDRIFDSSETTSDVYEEIALPIVGKAMDGVNGTIFAYGQTASGKTYTMMGDRMCPGIIPRAVQDIFTHIDNTSNREFLLRVSYMELYNEGLSDLLSSEKKTLQIRENDKNVFVHDLTEEVVTNVQEVLHFLKKGEARRHFGQTDMNERSSRSHTIFRMIIESREICQGRKSIDTAVKVSHLNLVDLAGSERANETKADGIRLREACKINQSLHVLAMVINKLSQGAEFIPFRDSKLTRILQMSLGGNAKTAIICTVTPISVEQTHSTLQFASRAKTIKNKPEVNEVVSDEAMMQRQKKEIQELKRKISELEQQGELFEEKSRLHETQEQKIKILEKMILVSGGAGISGILPTNETTKAKYKRRQTWCPGMANHLPLLTPKPPLELASFITEETSTPESGTQSSRSPDEEMRLSDTGVSPQESITSVESEEFSNTKQFQFWQDMEQEQKETEDGVIAFPLSPQRKKRKRREAHVHFAAVGLGSVDAECQTTEDQTSCLADLMSKNQALELKIQQLEEENLMVSQLSDALCLSEEKVADLESQAKDTDHQISSLMEDVGLLKAQLKDIDTLKESLENSEQEVRALKADLEEHDTVLASSAQKELEILSLKDQLEENEHLRDLAQQSERETLALKAELSEMEKEVMLMKTQLEQHDWVKDSLSKSEQEILALKAKLEETALLLVFAEEKEQEAMLMKEQLNQQELNQAALSKSEQEIVSLRAKLEKTELLLESAKEKEEEVVQLKTQLDQQDQLKDSFQKSELEISSLKAQLEEHEMRSASTLENEQKVLDLTAQLEQKDQQLRSLFQKSEQEILVLKAKLEETELLVVSAEENEQEAMLMKEQLNQQDELKITLSKSEQEIMALRAKLEKTELLLESAKEKEEEVVQMKTQLDQQDQLKDSLQKSELEISSLKAQLEEYEMRSASTPENEQKVLDLTAQLEQQDQQLKSLFEKSEQEILALKEELQERDTHMAFLLENKEEVLPSQALEEQRSEAEKKQQESAAWIATRSQQENAASVAGVSDVSSDEEKRDLKRTKVSQEEREEAHEKIQELTKILSARQEEIDTLNLFLVEQGKEAEETRNHHIARISELTALLEDQQGQIAMAAGPSMGCVERVDEVMSLGDEIKAEKWKAKARRAESELEGSVQLCEDVMEDRTKLSRQVSQFQDEVTKLKEAFKAKKEELEELQEFTQMEMLFMKEQEAQYQRDIEELRLKLQEKQDTVSVQHHKEIEDLQKKLGVKDKVLEAQYQQDVDELLDKLREKNQKLDNLQEQQSSLVQAASLAEQKVEQLQCQLRDVEGCGNMKENSPMEGQDQVTVQQVVDQQVQTEECNEESSLPIAVSLVEEATQVSPEDLGLIVDGSSLKPEVLQQRVDELEVLEASLRQECETLNATISSQDQEIEVLNELLEDLGQETKDNSENNAKIAAFVERIEQLEKQLEKRGLPTTDHIKEPDVVQEIQVLTEVNENLRKELEDSNEANFCLSEKLTCTQDLCEKLEGKLLQSADGEKEENREEIRNLTAVIEQQGQEMASQRVRLEEAEDNLRSNVRNLEDSVASLKQDNQSLVERCVSEATKHDQIVEDIKSKDILLAEQLNKLKTLSERLVKVEEELQGRTVKVQELEAALASQSSQSAEATEIIRMRDGELEMLQEVLQEQEQHLESVKNDFSQAQFKIKDLEREVNFLNETKGDQIIHEGQKENEIHRLHGLLENQQEQLRTKEQHLMESLSKIQNLESVLAANNHTNLKKSKAEAEQNDKIHKLQNYLEELENQLRTREITCSELEAKLQDLERVFAANDRKRVDLEDVKLKLESEVKTMQGYLDEVDEELHQFKNRYAELQADFRKQQTNMKNIEAVLESKSQSTKMLEAAVAKHDKEVGVLRAVLDERNNTALMQEDRYCEMLVKIQNLEGIITSKEQATEEMKNSLKIQDAELQRLQAAQTSSQEQQDRRLQEEITRREEEILNLRQQLENAMEILKTSTSMSPDELSKLLEEKNDLQSQLDQTNQKLTNKIARMTKLGKIYEDLRTTCSEIEKEYEDEKAQHQETKDKLQKAQTDHANLEHLELQRSSIDDLMKTHRQQLAEKNLRINQLETDLLRGTDPLEKKLMSLREEVSYQESKVQQYKKEVERLRSQQSQKAPTASSTTAESSSILERTPEATGGSGIIESCAIFAIKAENYKLTKTLEKTKKELEYKDLKYHDEVTKKTHAEQDARYWKEKARSLASHLKRAPQKNDSVTASPLKERNTIDPTLAKKSRSDDSAGTRYVEKIAGLKNSSAIESSSSKRPDYNWLSKAVAERDAEERQNQEDDPQQCTTQ